MARAFYVPTDDQLQQAPPRVLYELDMFFASANTCLGLNKDHEASLYNAALEATLLHARNLLDFFTGDQTPKDDIRAAHFLPAAASGWWKSSRLGLLNSLRNELNYSISHLTYRRTLGKPQWDLAGMASEVRAAFEEFIGLLPEPEQSRWRRNG
jgi:hypothetical protein